MHRPPVDPLKPIRVNQSPFCLLLPDTVLVADTLIDASMDSPQTQTALVAWQQGLLPEEQAHIARAVSKRREEFTAGRNCARALMRRLDLPLQAVLTGQQREPLFPAELIGTISHTELKHSGNDIIKRYCACAINQQIRSSQQANLLSIGIDTEANQPLQTSTLSMISSHHERTQLTTLPKTLSMAATPDAANTAYIAAPHWETVLFSAKESFYKAYFPIMQQYLDFLDAEITLSPPDPSSSALIGEFSIQIINPTKLATVAQTQRTANASRLSATQLAQLHTQAHVGYFTWDSDFLYTAIVLEQ